MTDISQIPPTDREIAEALALRAAGLITPPQLRVLTGLDGAALRVWLADPENVGQLELAKLELRQSSQYAERAARDLVEPAIAVLRETLADEDATRSQKLDAVKEVMSVVGARGARDSRAVGNDGYGRLQGNVRVRIHALNRETGADELIAGIDVDKHRRITQVTGPNEERRLAEEARRQAHPPQTIDAQPEASGNE